MVISLLEASLDNDQPKSVTKPLQNRFELTVLLISPNTFGLILLNFKIAGFILFYPVLFLKSTIDYIGYDSKP